MSELLDEDEIVEIMYVRDASLEEASKLREPSKTSILKIQMSLLDADLIKWVRTGTEKYGPWAPKGCWKLTQKAKDYIQEKRKAGLNRFNTKMLNQKEQKYVEGYLNFEIN